MVFGCMEGRGEQFQRAFWDIEEMSLALSTCARPSVGMWSSVMSPSTLALVELKDTKGLATREEWKNPPAHSLVVVSALPDMTDGAA